MVDIVEDVVTESVTSVSDEIDAAATKSSESATPTEKYYRVDRERIYDHMSEADVLRLMLHIESDLYEYSADGTLAKEPAIKNKAKFVTNGSFKTVKALNEFFTKRGKIPPFLEVRESPGKGWGVFTTADIKQGTFLGLYEGIQRIGSVNSKTNGYIFTLTDNQGKPVVVIDSENILFSNWARFLNDGKIVNCVFIKDHFQVMIFAGADISKGSELLVSYGDTYFASREIKKVD